LAADPADPREVRAHYQTGEPMPAALVDKIKNADKFNQGFATVEYLSSALVDMKLHLDPDGVVDPDAFEKKTLAELGMPKEMVMRHRLPQFGHLFSSDGYSAGYYSYLWSETMDADTWEAFEKRPVQPDDRRQFPQISAVDRQRDRPGRGLSPVPRPRSRRRGAAQAARFPGRLSGGGCGGAVHRLQLLAEADGEAMLQGMARVGIGGEIGVERAALRAPEARRLVRVTVAIAADSPSTVASPTSWPGTTRPTSLPCEWTSPAPVAR
jgi:hypothetical protein